MRVRVPFRSPDAQSWLTPMRLLVVLTWAAVFVPRVLQSLTAPKFRLQVGEAVSYTPLAGLAERLLQLTLLGACVLIVLSRVRRLPSGITWRLVVLLLPWVYLVSHDLLLDNRPNTTALLYAAVVVAVWVLQPAFEELRLVAVLGVALTAVAVLLAVLLPDQGILSNAAGEAVNPTKTVLPIGILIGPLTSGNNLGQILAVTAPAVLLLRGRARYAASVLLLFALLWTASRSSILAVLLAAATVVVLRRVAPEVRAGLAGLAVSCALAFSVLLPFLTRDDLAFTNRGYIWRRSLEAWGQSPWFGLGSDYYARTGGSSDQIVETAFHGHNEVVQLLVTGGWVLLVLFVLVMLTALVVAARWAGRGVYYPVAFLVALCVSCSLEVSVGFVDRVFMLPTAILPLAVVLLSPQSSGRRGLRRAALVTPPTGIPMPLVPARAGGGDDGAWRPTDMPPRRPQGSAKRPSRGS